MMTGLINWVLVLSGLPYTMPTRLYLAFKYPNATVYRLNVGGSHSIKYYIEDEYQKLFCKVDTLYGKWYRWRHRNDYNAVFERNVREEGEYTDFVSQLGYTPQVITVGKNFYVCEWVEGDTWKEYCKLKDKKNVDKVLKKILRLYKLLDGYNLWHDGNPDNIIITAKQEPCLIDFQYVRKGFLCNGGRVRECVQS